jgi:hypothetical protein
MMSLLAFATKAGHFLTQKNGICRLKTRDEKYRGIERKPDTFLPSSIQVSSISLSSMFMVLLPGTPAGISFVFSLKKLDSAPRLGSLPTNVRYSPSTVAFS